MKPPIIINDSHDPQRSGDLCVYDSVEWAQRGVEAPDAKDPSVQVYDSAGRRLRIVPVGVYGEVRLEPVEGEPSDGDLLVKLLRDFLARIDAPPHLVERPLHEMLDYVYQRDPNPYSGYRRPDQATPGFLRGLIQWFSPPKRR